MVAAENGGWVGHMGEVAPSRAFLFYFFGSFNASTAYPEKRGSSVHPKTCFGGGCVPLGSICPGGQIFLFLPQKPFFNGPNKAIVK